MAVVGEQEPLTMRRGRAVRPKNSQGRPRGRHGTMVMLGQLGIVLLFLGVWQLLSGRVIDYFLISNPVDVIAKLYNVLGDSTMHGHIMATGQELILGWALGASAGAVMGWALGAFKTAGEIMEPILNAINGIPKVALAPMMLLWFGLGMGSKIAIASMIVFFLVFFNVYSGMRNVPQPLVEVARSMGASRMFVVRKVVLPSVSVPLFAGLKAGVSFAMIGVIAGEFISADKGLGYYSMTSTQQFDPAGLFAALVIIVAMVVFGSSLIGVFERRALKWQRD
ncbi:ABC transporter permease [Streptomyces sp. NPDC087263]|uniref:ABC transporter permease n=1 Tax=Streptomyces sp. NPDC087263 TaxID=3365773 RepID=UPI003806FFF9